MKHKRPLLTFAGRGINTVISTYGVTDADWQVCQQCNACVLVCPVGALVADDGQSQAVV